MVKDYIILQFSNTCSGEEFLKSNIKSNILLATAAVIMNRVKQWLLSGNLWLNRTKSK